MKVQNLFASAELGDQLQKLEMHQKNLERNYKSVSVDFSVKGAFFTLEKNILGTECGVDFESCDKVMAINIIDAIKKRIDVINVALKNYGVEI